MESESPGPGGHDAPVSKQTDDLLNRWGVARAIDRTIETAPQGWSTRVGLYGAWGGGKTSVLRFLRTMTEERGDIVVEFSAWQAQGEGGVLKLFYEEFLNALKAKRRNVEPTPGRIKRMFSGVAKAGKEIGGAGAQAAGPADGDIAQLATTASLALSMASSALGGVAKLTPNDLSKLQQALGRNKVVVFIDDLDRTDPRLIPRTLLGLRELLDWPNFAFVLAFDKRVVSSALAEYSKAFGDSADDFLEKVVDVQFALPEPTTDQIAALAEDGMGRLCSFMPQEARSRASRFFPSNPRQSKQVVRSLATLRASAERHDRDELNWTGIALQTILRLAAPDVAASFEAQPIGADLGGFRLEDERAAARLQQVEDALSNDTQVDGPGRARLAQRRVWLRALMAEIHLVRRRDQPERRDYEMRLAVEEPPFTHREIRELVAAAADDPTKVDFRRAVSSAVRRSNQTHIQSALNLVKSSLAQLSAVNNQLIGTLSATHIARARDDVDRTLRFVELLWASENVNVGSARHRFEVAQQVLEVASAFALRADGAGGAALLERQILLSRTAARECVAPWKMYFLANPHRGEPRNARVRELLAMIREELETQVVAELLGMFTRRDGLTLGLRRGEGDDEGEVLFILEAMDSPLYRGRWRAQLVELLLSATASTGEQSEILSQNAVKYLTTIAMMSTSTGWINDYAAFGDMHGEVLTAAWMAAVSEDAEFRSAEFLRRLRAGLVERGLPESLFEIPAWMIPPASMSPLPPAPPSLSTVTIVDEEVDDLT